MVLQVHTSGYTPRRVCAAWRLPNESVGPGIMEALAYTLGPSIGVEWQRLAQLRGSAGSWLRGRDSAVRVEWGPHVAIIWRVSINQRGEVDMGVFGSSRCGCPGGDVRVGSCSPSTYRISIVIYMYI